MLVQILVTLLNQSAESALKTSEDTPEIKIKGHTEKTDTGNSVHFTILNNGPQHSPEEPKQIFTCGVPDNHNIIPITGLNWCSNVISAMNGRLYAENDEITGGLCFHLLLPEALT